MLNDRPSPARNMAHDLRVGDPLPALAFEVSAAQIFMYSAIPWNRHQIHYNQAQHHHATLAPRIQLSVGHLFAVAQRQLKLLAVTFLG